MFGSLLDVILWLLWVCLFRYTIDKEETPILWWAFWIFSVFTGLLLLRTIVAYLTT